MPYASRAVGERYADGGGDASTVDRELATSFVPTLARVGCRLISRVSSPPLPVGWSKRKKKRKKENDKYEGPSLAIGHVSRSSSGLVFDSCPSRSPFLSVRTFSERIPRRIVSIVLALHLIPGKEKRNTRVCVPRNAKRMP